MELIQAKTPVMLFKADGLGHTDGNTYWTVSRQAYQIQPGDLLEYAVFIDKANMQLQCAMDLHFQSGKNLRDSGALDQNGISAHPWHSLLDAGDAWFHRVIRLDRLVGQVTASWELVYHGGLKEPYLACFSHIRIVRDGKTQIEICRDGVPEVSELKMHFSFENEKIITILWQDFRKTKMELIDPRKLSAEIIAARMLQRLHPDQAGNWEAAILEAEKTLDRDAYIAGNEEKFQNSLQKIRDLLLPILKNTKNYTAHLVGHAHIDMNWLWTWDETLAVCHRDFDTMTKLMNEFPTFHFSQSQAVTYKVIEQAYPDIFERIRKFVNRKQWEITASMWVEGDENMASGEAIVRQFLLAKNYIMEKFGVEPVVTWQPDLFGHAWTMPQIIKKCGSKYYFFMRCPKKDTTAFWWQAPDGSKVLAFNTNNYNNTISPLLATHPIRLFEKEGVSHYLHSYGVGDHGGGPTRIDIETVLKMQQSPTIPKLKFNSAESFFQSLETSGVELPVVNDELQFIFSGCYTTHADIKQRNRKGENLYPVLEFFGVMAMPFELPYPTQILNQGWERNCFNHFHDILTGSGIHAAYQEGLPITDGVLAAGEAALQRTLRTLAGQIKTDLFPGQEPIVVFNAANWVRSDRVEIELTLNQDAWVEVLDQSQQPIPCQIVTRTHSGARIIFVAPDVPAMGYKTFWWRSVQIAPAANPNLKMTGTSALENQFYQMKIDPATGHLISLIDKASGREFIAPGAAGNVFQLHSEKPNGMSAWVIGEVDSVLDLTKPVKVEVLETGPVRLLLQVVYRHNQSEFRQRIALYHGLQRIDFPCTVDWFEQGTRENNGTMLKVAFPVAINPEEVTATFDIPFGFIERKPDGTEVPAQKWIDVADRTAGMSLLNDSKYGHDVSKNVMRLTLLRSSYEPDHEPDQGRQEFTYALFPHAGNWKTAGSERRGLELNQPLRAIALKPLAGEWPSARSLVECPTANVMVSAFKKCEKDGSLILRFYETQGKPAEVQFKFGFTIHSVIETDMIERELEGGEIPVDANGFTTGLTPFEVKTVKIRRDGYTWPSRHGFVPVEPRWFDVPK